MRRSVPAGMNAGVGVMAVGVSLLIASLAAQQSPPGGAAAPGKPLVPLAASTLAANPDPYFGENISLAATVESRLADLVLAVDHDRTKSTGKEILVLMRRVNGPVDLNTYVTVIGELTRFDPDTLADKMKEYPVKLTPDLIAKYRGRPVVLATSVVNSAGLDVMMRLPPPMTAEEEAYSKIMKKVAPANAALRKALEGSDANLAKEQAAALKEAFAEAQAFWKTKNKSDAAGWAGDARQFAESIDTAAAGGKWDEVKTLTGSLGKTCQTCHNAYRERFDDGSFRIKLGG